MVAIKTLILCALLVVCVHAHTGFKSRQDPPGTRAKPESPPGGGSSAVCQLEITAAGTEVPVDGLESISIFAQSEDDADSIKIRHGRGAWKKLADDDDSTASGTRSEKFANGRKGAAKNIRPRRFGAWKGKALKVRRNRNRGRAAAILKFVKSSLELSCSHTCDDVVVGDSCTFECRFVNGEDGVCGCGTTATFTVNGQQVATSTAQDCGVMSADIPIDHKNVHVVVQATNDCDGGCRTYKELLGPSDRLFSSIASAHLSIGDQQTQEVDVTICASLAGDAHVHEASLVDFTLNDANGALVEVSSLAEHDENGCMTVVVQPEWFDNGAGDYFLSDVKIQCPHQFNTLASADSVPATYDSQTFHPASTSRHHLFQISESSAERLQRIRHGRKPTNKEMAEIHENHKARYNRRVQFEKARGDGHPFNHYHTLGGGCDSAGQGGSNWANGGSLTNRLVHVHGYCGSADTWNYSGEGWTGAKEKFVDACQSISHYTFASRLRTFLGTSGSCGVVAHSQGGAAAWYLVNRWWTCLDNGSTNNDSNRWIQTVGTPYRGTPLASWSDLGSIFGVGCGYVYDLTPAGGHAFTQNEIGNSYTSRLWYYRTRDDTSTDFLDGCSAASWAILDGQDDGTTQVDDEYCHSRNLFGWCTSYRKQGGHINGGGAHNMGVVSDQCHTRDMNSDHDPQCADVSRNGIMNSKAQR